MHRSFELVDGSSAKFWRIETASKSLTVTFGRIGTAGQSQVKKLASDAACTKEAESLIASKIKKGYVETSDASSTSAPKSKTKPADKPAKQAKVVKDGAALTKLSAKDLVALHRAIEMGLEPKVKAAILGADLNVEISLKYEKTTPLLSAAAHGHEKIVALLLAAGANPNLTIADDTSPLHRTRSADVAKLLIAAGADVNARDKWERTPLFVACQSDRLDLVLALLDAGADVEAKNNEGLTPYLASRSFPLRQALLKRGAKGLAVKDGHELMPKTSVAKPTDVAVDRGAIGHDGEGNIWMWGYTGMFRFDGKVITRFEFRENDNFSVDNIQPGPKGSVFFASASGLVHFAEGKWRLYSETDSEIHDSHITEMAVDRSGRPHLMGYGGEETVDRPISVFDGKGFNVLTAGDGIPKGLEVKALAFDGKNELLLATDEAIHFPRGKLWKPPSKFSSGFDAITVDGDIVWAAYSSTLHRIENGKTKSFEFQDGVKAICIDGDVTWVGLSYGGLGRLDADGKITIFKEADSGLPDDDVEGLALDRNGTLWIKAGDKVALMKGGTIETFGGAKAAEEEAPEPSEKKEKLELPTEPFVPRAKLPKFVVDAVNKARPVLAEVAFTFLRPAIGFEIAPSTSAVPVGKSKFGGRPDLSTGASWPTFEDDEARNLPLLFQINLEDVAAFDVEGLLPKKGLLAFFAETVPDELDNACVIHTDAGSKLERLAWPEDLADRKNEDDFVAQLPEHALTFYATWTLPSLETLAAYIDLDDADERALGEIGKAIHAQDPKKSSTTRLLGWPDDLQGAVTKTGATIVLAQIDASMNAPKGIKQVFTQWGEGIAHYLIGGDALAKRKLDAASAILAYT